MPFGHYATTILQRCDELARVSQNPEFIDRRYLTKEHKQANGILANWMKLAGMSSWTDEAGNQWGQYKSPLPDAKTLIIGSHLDTVPNSGKYDGILGVLLPVTLVQYFKDNDIILPFNLNVVAFADEEGTRFGTTLLGSRAIAGTWQDKWASLKDENGTTLPTAMREFGLDINNVHHAAMSSKNLMGFLEIHIEQGPVLESQKQPVGIVTGIAGAKRFVIEVNGHAGHAGTVPMALRQDALTGAAEMVLAIERAASDMNVVATVGQIASKSNAVNVISGRVDFSLDVRSLDNLLRDQCIARIEHELMVIAQKRGLGLTVKPTHEASSTPCNQGLMEKLTHACEMNGLLPFELTSGAGHDAMAMADLCPMSMLFVRCAKGISHNPAESVTVEDVATALLVTKSFVEINAKNEQASLVA